jgi:hypothetical protein
MEEEIFCVEVNEEGRTLLQRFAKLSLLILIFTLILGALQTVSSLYAFFKAVRHSSFSGKLQYNYYLTMAYVLLNFLLQAVQVIWYRRFAKIATLCLNHSDSPGFNRSFRLLNMQALCFLLQLGLTAFFMVVRLSNLF